MSTRADVQRTRGGQARGMKRIALVALVVLLPIGYLFWPYDKLVLALNANGRAEHDLVAGYPAALERTREVEAAVRQQYPDLGRAKHSWTEVRCGIDDLVTQFPGGDFWQECSLRSVWLFPAPYGGVCAGVEDLYGGTDPEGDATATRVRVSAEDLVADPDPLAARCPVVGPEPLEFSRFIYGTAYPRLVSGRWADHLEESPGWDVLEVEVFLSHTEIGCLPAPGFCESRFDRPSMGGVGALATPS